MKGFFCDSPWCGCRNEGEFHGNRVFFTEDRKPACPRGSACSCRERKALDYRLLFNASVLTATAFAGAAAVAETCGHGLFPLATNKTPASPLPEESPYMSPEEVNRWVDQALKQAFPDVSGER